MCNASWELIGNGSGRFYPLRSGACARTSVGPISPSSPGLLPSPFSLCTCTAEFAPRPAPLSRRPPCRYPRGVLSPPLPALDAGDRRGSLPGLPYCCSAGLTLATVVGEPHCCSVVTVNTSNTVQLPTLNSSNGVLQPAPRSANLDSAFGGMQLFATEAWRAASLLLTRSAQLAQPTVRLPPAVTAMGSPSLALSHLCSAACVSDTARRLPAHCETMGVR